MIENINLATIATIAVIGGFGHCLGMCGGIVLAISNTKINNQNKIIMSLSHIIYSLGRVSTYTVFGAVFGLLGSVVSLSNFSVALLWFFTGTVMILIGLSLAGWLKFVTMFEVNISQYNWYKNSFKKLIHSKSNLSLYLLGVLNGAIPCGFVYFFGFAAAASGSAISGALVMFVFGISTIPALFLFGFFSSYFQNQKTKKFMTIVSSLLVIIFGLWTIQKGIMFINNPDKTIIEKVKAKHDLRKLYK